MGKGHGVWTRLLAKDKLKVTDPAVCYGQIEAVKGISFKVGEGRIVALIGANGAGGHRPIAAAPPKDQVARTYLGGAAEVVQ